MSYSEFVKEHMLKLKGSDMSAPEKMKFIGEQWRKSKSSTETKKPIQNKKPTQKPVKNSKKHSDEILNMLGVDIKKSKPRKKSDRAVKKVVKAMEKMKLPVEEKTEEIPKHPIHLLEKEPVQHKQLFDDDDNIGF